MPQYHIASNGKPAVCKAEQRACPLGGDHYEDEVAALRGALDRALGSVTLLETADDGNGNGRPRPDSIPEWVSTASLGGKLQRLTDNNLHPDILSYLSTDSDGYIRDAIARHPKTPTEVLDRYLADETEDGKVRWLSVAANPALTPIQQINLYKKAGVRVRTALMNRTEVPLGVARLVKNDQQVTVRTALASKLSNHQLIHFMLAKDINNNVRLAVARNPTATETALRVLSEDRDPSIARVARLSLARIPLRTA